MGKRVRQRFPYTDSLWYRPKTREEWLLQRLNDVTATESAALFGVSPYLTPFELFHQKAGNLTAEFEQTDRMRWGSRLQDAIARGICEDRGWRIISAEPFLYVRSTRFVGMAASPDYVVLCPVRGVGLLEIKNVDKFVAREDWADDEAPVHIEFQLQHQLECAQFDWGAIGGLVGGNDARVIIRERDAEVGTEIGNRITDLWRRVRDQDPPAPNFLADYDSIRRLYQNAEVGKVLDVGAMEVGQPERLAELCEAERAASVAKKHAEEDQQRAKAEILTLIEDAETVSGIPGFKLRATTQHREERTQVVKATSFRDLRVTREKPKTAKTMTDAEAAAFIAEHPAA